MARRAVTFDFHNTLVHCDDWFELEVRTLPSAFAGWHAERHGPIAANEDAAAFDAAYRTLRRSIIEHGHELTAERSLAVVFGQFGIHVDDVELAEGVHDLMSGALSSATAVPGAVESVRALSERNVPLGVVSSAVYHPFLEWALARIGLGDAFEIIVTSASCGYYKSRPEIYWHTLDALEARPDASLHIGDSLRFDVGGAARAGMRTVWLDHGAAPSPDYAPDLSISTLQGAAPRIVDLLERS